MRLKERIAAGALALAIGACSTTAPQGGPEPATSAKALDKPQFRQSDLSGKTARAIDELLGAPALVRMEGKGEFRRYAFAACTLIIILYQDEKGAVAVRELDASAKVSGEPKPDLDVCLARGPAPPPPDLNS